MKRSGFFFELPEELIAQFPPPERGQSRLMVLDRLTRTRLHRMTADLPSLLEPGSLFVFNNSRVRRARLYGRSASSGGRAAFLLLDRIGPDLWRVMAQRAKRRRPGSRYLFEDGVEGEIAGGEGEFRLLRFNKAIDDAWLDRYGHVPLPPYIRREDVPADGERYQTVYAGPPGSAAAPTAGLHFTGELLSQLENAGMECVFITLHVGLGTFLPVRTENIEDHRMHEESFSIDEAAAARIEKAKAEGRKIAAVGTTSVRALESAWQMPAGGAPGSLRRGAGTTSIFIYPGRRFNVVDALFTNFHTPESTLLMLVSAFAEAKPAFFAGIHSGVAEVEPGAGIHSGGLSGRDFILESYAEAVREGYRFFSYGDAMLIR